MRSRISKTATLFALALAGMNAGVAAAQDAPGPKVTDPHFQLAAGYIPPKELPDSLELLGPPPAKGSAALALSLIHI